MVKVAEKTLQLIEDTLTLDQCAQFRQTLKTLLPKMDDAYRGREKPYRKHLGASLIGRPCARQLQLMWRWTTKGGLPARVLRLFNRGHLEEARFLAMLQCLEGVEVWFETDDGGQYKWQYFNGHYGSALDGIATGIPDIPNGEPCYTEFKTSAKKGFDATVKKGCMEEHYEHYVQMQECMMAYNLKYALYMMVCKDNDELYAEIIEYDHDVATRYQRRAGEIIFTTDAMPRLSNDPRWYECKFCDVKAVCHGKQLPQINCRTCCHWSPEEDGSYSCARSNPEVFGDSSMEGCEEHVYDPTLLPAFEFVGADENANATCLRKRGTMSEPFWQGPNHLTSREFAKRVSDGSL